MAYEKQTWRCGDTITNTGLNHMEDGIKTNDTAIANLQTQINNIDLGYSCSESRQTVFDGEYTTVKEEGSSSATYENIMPQTSTVPNILIVTFNGTEYSCPNHDNEFGAPYSSDGFDWSSYPFNILFLSLNGKAFLSTENAGTYSVKAEVMAETAETSECFDLAVKSVVGEPLFITTRLGREDAETTYYALNASSEDIYSAYQSGRRVLVQGGSAEDIHELVYAEKHMSCGGTNYTFGVAWDDRSSSIGYGNLLIWNFGATNDSLAKHYTQNE